MCEIFNTKADFVRKGDSSVKTDKADQRTRITKKMIREAFLTLLSGKDIRHITVRELCEPGHRSIGEPFINIILMCMT